MKIRVEGDRRTIDEYVHDLRVGPPLADVARVSVTPLPFTGQYGDFSVRFSEGR